MNILIVDDEPINVLLLESLLNGKYETKTAENGQVAYNMIEEQIPDIVLLDVLMPVMDGFETLKKIRSNKNFSNLIAIMVTAKVEKEDVRKAMLLGADDYIKKPIDATELYTKIDIHSKLRKSTRQVLEYQVYANIHESMITAQRIQYSLLPDKSYFSKLFPNSFTLYKPRDMIGGDLYFVSEKGSSKFICVSDSTGHGVPAALLSMLTYMGLNYIVNKLDIINPTDVAISLSREITASLDSSADTYVASHELDAVFCEINLQNMLLKYVGVRRPMVIIRKTTNYIILNDDKVNPTISEGNNHLFYIRSDFLVPGEELSNKNLHTHIIELKTGDMLYMFSDGITDQFGGPKEKKFSKRSFLQLLLKSQGSPLKIQKLQIYQEIEKWSMNVEQTDDIVLIGIEI